MDFGSLPGDALPFSTTEQDDGEWQNMRIMVYAEQFSYVSTIVNDSTHTFALTSEC